ncbi:photosynthetic reaction center cytochrome PufC [Erythrobacter sp. LQ02-29]|uniref:photosynthetic reaction center cytochrome PufC n=1 Tax=Erythrobacter sp. LQ02-29 TaxID=2920384 RepID=UPI001F4DBF03|nr:photosynthetic reaction center cytochrome PufC [Erythrobacter sp. LQ02-29]MCP9223845.1 photosynthetic reaction center cytochrome PufC [Erythrobacter sp. LQ02-29]
MKYGPVIFALALAVLAFVLLVPPWISPANVGTTQIGPDASAMGLYIDERESAKPAVQPEFMLASLETSSGGQGGYTNLQVLNGEAPAEIDRTMRALTAWVAPEQGCGFCHGGQSGPNANWAADYPRKEVARQMLRMVRDVNSRWTNHVGSQGVTCFSCHQGKNVPEYKWFITPKPTPPLGGMAGKPQEWHTKATTIRDFFPSTPEELYLLKGEPAKLVQARQPLVGGPVPQNHNLEAGENVYILMMQMSQGIGVNCTFCHQSRALFDWSQSPPNRLNGYSGIKMTLDLNQRVFSQLGPIASTEAKGQLGDPAKINCASCHNQHQKPAGGMTTTYYPALVGPAVPAPANPVAAANPGIWQLARHPRVGPVQEARR